MDQSLFLVEKAKHIVIRSADGRELNFRADSFELLCPFDKYGVDISGMWYICYEPGHSVLDERPIDKDMPIREQVSGYQSIIDDFDVIYSLFVDPFLGKSVAECRQIAESNLQREAEMNISQIWSIQEQLNYALGILPKDQVFDDKVSQSQSVISNMAVRRDSVRNANDINSIRMTVFDTPDNAKAK